MLFNWIALLIYGRMEGLCMDWRHYARTADRFKLRNQRLSGRTEQNNEKVRSPGQEKSTFETWTGCLPFWLVLPYFYLVCPCENQGSFLIRCYRHMPRPPPSKSWLTIHDHPRISFDCRTSVFEVACLNTVRLDHFDCVKIFIPFPVHLVQRKLKSFCK